MPRTGQKRLLRCFDCHLDLFYKLPQRIVMHPWLNNFLGTQSSIDLVTCSFKGIRSFVLAECVRTLATNFVIGLERN